MDVETITKLLDAGYTKAEIDKMAGGAADQQGEAGAADNESAGEEQSTAGQENASRVVTNVEITAAIEALTNTVTGLKAWLWAPARCWTISTSWATCWTPTAATSKCIGAGGRNAEGNPLPRWLPALFCKIFWEGRS